MNSKMIISVCNLALLFVLLMATTTTASASTMESSSLRGGNPAANTTAISAVTASASHSNSELTHVLFSSVTDTVRKLWHGCGIVHDDTCNDNEYYPMKCKKNKRMKAVFRSKCHARLAGYEVSPDGGAMGFVPGDECTLIEECNYFERGRNTDPVTCNGSTWPDRCVAERFGNCLFL